MGDRKQPTPPPDDQVRPNPPPAPPRAINESSLRNTAVFPADLTNREDEATAVLRARLKQVRELLSKGRIDYAQSILGRAIDSLDK